MPAGGGAHRPPTTPSSMLIAEDGGGNYSVFRHCLPIPHDMPEDVALCACT
jgi:hypothetical protein